MDADRHWGACVLPASFHICIRLRCAYHIKWVFAQTSLGKDLARIEEGGGGGANGQQKEEKIHNST